MTHQLDARWWNAGCASVLHCGSRRTCSQRRKSRHFGRIAALPPVAARLRLERDDLLAGLGIFLIVVVSTLPVVLPFLVVADVGTAKFVSRAVALAMLFFGGLVLGRYAGYGSWKVGLTMVGLDTGLVIVINTLGG